MRSKISIIIPVYNAEKYLFQCLESIINQSYKNIEIICVNDESTDNSMQILQSYALNDSRIKIVDKKNGGPSSARNEAHKHVTGQYIMYLDSDDWIESDTCEVALNHAEMEKADVVFWNYVREYYGRTKQKYIFEKTPLVFETKEQIRRLHRRFIGLYEDELRHPENADSIVTVWGKLYKSSIILNNQVEFVDTRIVGTSEDALFNLHVFGYVNKAVYLPDCFYHYRKTNESSFTKVYKDNLKKQWDTLFGYMQQYILDNNCNEKYRIALNNRISLSIIGLGMNILNGDQKIREIKKIISEEAYRRAIKQLTLKYFPMHWKGFFWLAKINNAIGVYMLLACIKKIRGN